MSTEKQHIDENTLGWRLKLVLRKKGMSQQHLADTMEIDKGQVSRWTRNKVQPEVNSMLEICKITDCEFSYLDTGGGEMFKERASEQISTSEPEQKMIRHYRQLATLDKDTLKEVQTWINDMEKYRPGFETWFRVEFQNRFPEFDEWKEKIIKKTTCPDHQNRLSQANECNKK